MDAMTGLSVEAQERVGVCACGGVLPQVRVVTGFREEDAKWVPSRCGACRNAAMTVEAKRDEDAAREARVRVLGVPPMYRDASPGTWQVRPDTWDAAAVDSKLNAIKHRAVDWMRRYDVGVKDEQARSEVPAIVVLSGPPGTGKTFWAWVIAKHVGVEHGRTVTVSLFDDVVRDLRGTWGDGDGNSESEAARLARYRQVDLLVLDEVSRHAMSAKSVQHHLYSLLATREQWYRPTILTTNESGTALAEVFGPALMSRVMAWDAGWSFAGIADHRAEQRRKRIEATSTGAGT